MVGWYELGGWRGGEGIQGETREEGRFGMGGELREIELPDGWWIYVGR